MESYQDLIVKSTVPLFEEEKNKPQLAGTGVLLKLGTSCYLITAGHNAINRNDLFIILNTSRKEVVLGGNLITCSGRQNEDHLDFSVMRLIKEQTDDLVQDFSFLDESLLAMNHIPEYAANQFRYLVYGYPITRTRKIWNQPVVRSKPFIFSSYLLDAESQRVLGYPLESNLLIHFNPKKVYNRPSGQLQIPPKLKGISGCGLWHTGNSARGLLGVVIERKDVNGVSAIVATRIDVVTEAIRVWFDPSVEASRTIRAGNIKVNNSSLPT